LAKFDPSFRQWIVVWRPNRSALARLAEIPDDDACVNYIEVAVDYLFASESRLAKRHTGTLIAISTGVGTTRSKAFSCVAESEQWTGRATMLGAKLQTN
jgi:hypothetical protein